MKSYSIRHLHSRWMKSLLGQLRAKLLTPASDSSNMHIPERLSEGIKLVARIENVSFDDAVSVLLEEGFKKYVGEKLKEDIEEKRKIKEMNLQWQPRPTRFARVLRKFARERGMDVKKIV